eukprot:9880508-Prorocentrum_lima.AAC.1
MTSSLVGSEMCIRDRLVTTRRGVPTPDCHHRHQPLCTMHHPRTPEVPVSYTHLTLPTICSV